MMPTGHRTAPISIRGPGADTESVEKDTPLLERMGAGFIFRGGESCQIQGKHNERHRVMEHPSCERALAAYRDPECQAVAVIRRRKAVGSTMVAQGRDA